MECPKCNSTEVQKLSIVYKSGLSKIKTTTFGINIGALFNPCAIFTGILAAIGLYRTSGTQQTELSKMVSPPVKKTLWVTVIIFAYTLLELIRCIKAEIFTAHNTLDYFNTRMGLGGIILYLLVLFISSKYFLWASHYNKEELPKLYAEWDNKFICNRCENMFTLELPTS